MRLATFNLESLDLPPKAPRPLAERAAVLRPALARLRADVVCLQEVNGQHVPGQPERVLAALDALLDGTPYADFHRAATTAPGGHGVADVHNLVTLSRHPIRSVHEVRHALAPPLAATLVTDAPHANAPVPLTFDRPLLVTEIDVGGAALTVVNLHLRSPLAALVPGQKLGPFVWRSVGGWAEGFFIASLKRAGQALELRLLLDRLLGETPDRLIAVAGDFNAEDHETPVRIAVGAEEDTGNGALAGHTMTILDRALPADRRWSILHHGRPQMVDHILASRALLGRFKSIEVHNETLGDELVGFAKVDRPPGSYHAAVVAHFEF
ncbi:MAG: endonuclease/exonuclease/phosphatase family protein [Pseudomonadota bacterium]